LTTALASRSPDRKALWIGLLASIAPDLDLLYFFFVDKQQHLHHGYWTHFPFFWLGILTAALLAYPLLKRFRIFSLFLFCFLPNILLHLLLDSVVGDIRWLAPFSSQSFSLFEVPALHDYWVYNFVFHWTFLLEVSIVVAAILVLLVRCDRSKIQPQQSFGLIRRLERTTFDRQPDSRLSRASENESGYPEIERSSASG